MPDNLFRNKYRIPSARAVWHDYNGGAYFVTICTKDMAHFFGEIVDGEMCLTEIGRCADEQLRNALSLCENSIVGGDAQSCACNRDD